ncbi:Bardet-Biedl syndrome 10 protein isoform X2 [Elgaria multicarinata webbii]
MMIACISTHCNSIGDGAKTFIVLLSSLLQELQKLGKGDCVPFCENIQGREKHKETSYRLKQVSQFLMMIQADVLDPILTQDLEKHFLSVFSVPDAEISRTTMGLVLEAYFCGKVGNNRQKFLSQLTYNFFFKVTANKNRSEVLCLVDEYFAELHTSVTGLPVSNSRILDGLVLHRDFTIYCPTDGDQRVLIITESIHGSLSELGVEVALMAESQYKASEIWIAERTEALIKHMQNNNIKVLLSSVKQQESVHYCAKNSGISIVECLSPEEISLICRITEIPPFRPSLDNTGNEITKTAVAKFCQPLQLGAKRFVHIGFARTCALQLHCVIFCGPVLAVTEQHACAFHGAFKMLQQMLTALHLTKHCKSKSESQSLSEAGGSSSAVQQCFVEDHAGCSNVQASTKQLSPCGFKSEKLCVASTPVEGKELACSSVDLHKSYGIPMPNLVLQHDAMCSVLHESEKAFVNPLNRSQEYKYQKEMLKIAEYELLEDNQLEESTSSINIPAQLQIGEKREAPQPGLVQLNKSSIQSNSNFYIKAGSVVPVGGIFEILLHYYLSYYAKQCQSPNMSIVCTLIADVLLNVPKTLCRAQGRNAFPQLYLKVTNALRNNQQLQPNQKGLESVSCKYQLLVSVLQCAATLLSIDLIIGIKRLPQKAEDSDSDVDL